MATLVVVHAEKEEEPLTMRVHRYLALGAATLILTACSSANQASTSSTASTSLPEAGSRSVGEYCATFYGDGQEFRAKYEAIDLTHDPVGGLLALIGAPQEAALFFGRLEAVSSAAIGPDVTVLKDAMQHVSDNMASNARDPILGMLDAVSVSASTSGSVDRVNSYTLENCGPIPVNTSSPNASAPSVESASVPGPGDEILSLQIDGYAIADMAGDTIVTLASVNGSVGIRTFGSDGKPQSSNLNAESFDPSCKVAIVRRSDNVDIVFTIRTTDTAARGIEPAHQTQTLVAASGGDLTHPLWETDLGRDDEISYCSPGATNGNDLISNISFTSDGKWGLVTMTSDKGPRILDLATGKLREIANFQGPEDQVSVAGAYIIHDASGSYGEGEVRSLNPENGSVAGTTSELSVLRSHYISVDQDHLLATSSENGNSGTGVTQLLSLPSLQPVWSRKIPNDVGQAVFDSATGSLLLVGTPLQAVSMETGETRWQVEASSFCASSNGTTVVLANKQTAYLNAGTGEQIRYESDRSTCPTMLSETYAYSEVDSDSLTVYRFI